MKIAVTYENGQIYQHFGHCQNFKIYTIDNGAITSSEVVGTNGSGHGALSSFLKENEVDALICGGIGAGAQMALAQVGIQLFGGVCGNADQAVQDFLENKLQFNPNVKCNHHDHEHGNDEHKCGEHGCGKHGCHH